MSKCDHCGATILFGPVREGGFQYCNKTCRDKDVSRIAAEELPTDFIAEKVVEIHQGDCPKCGGPGPVDVHTSHWVWSALAFTRFSSKPEICCRGCGRRARRKAVLFNLLFGWWGFPWGILGTPAQILKNVGGGPRHDSEPSPELTGLVSKSLGAQLMASPRSARP